MQLLGSNHICLLKHLVPAAAGSYAKFCCYSNSKSLRVGWGRQSHMPAMLAAMSASVQVACRQKALLWNVLTFK